VKRGRKKRQPKCRIFSFNHRGSSWCSRPRFFFLLTFSLWQRRWSEFIFNSGFSLKFL